MDFKYIFEFGVLKQIGNTKQFSEIATYIIANHSRKENNQNFNNFIVNLLC